MHSFAKQSYEKDNDMDVIKRSSMKDQVYELVRERIFSGYYDPSEEIRILTLSKELEVSNTPIREALTMLAAEGLLTTSLNNKFRVVSLNEEMMAELNETILVLLTGGYLAAHNDGRDSGLEKMLTERLDAQKKALDAGDENEYLLRTLRFDRSFVEITGNSKLIGIFDNNNYLLYLFVRHTYWKDIDNREKKLKEHEKLISAVSSGDAKQVSILLSEHYNEHYGNA